LPFCKYHLAAERVAKGRLRNSAGPSSTKIKLSARPSASTKRENGGPCAQSWKKRSGRTSGRTRGGLAPYLFILS